LSRIRPRGTEISGNGKSEGVVPWAKIYDSSIIATNQGNVRRGAASVNLDINHADIDEFLEIRRPKGDPNRQCLNLHQCVVVDDHFMRRLETRDSEALNTWAKVLKSRMETGEPYIMYKDNVNKQNPMAYMLNNLDVTMTNICSEITLFTDEEHSFICCLSSLNLAKYEEWRDTDTVEIATWFLDGVMQEFIEKSEKDGLGKVLAIKAKANLDSIKQDEETAAAKSRINELEKESKVASAYAIADITAGLSNILGQETAAGKSIAVASATIDTYLSASTIFKQASKNPITVVNPAYPYLMAAPAVLAGIARVKQIVSVPVPRGGGSSASVPSMSSAAPIPPQLPQAQTTNISQQSINDIGNKAVRAYVVESDVTSNQQRIAAIRQRARFS
jgi:hypothetical protein